MNLQMKYLLFVSAVVMFAAISVSSQQRDPMTDPEIELIRENQDIDKRIDVLTKMIDRRFAALGVEVGGWKQAKKDSELWGEMRAGTKSELLFDIRQLLQKAIDDIDDVALHNEDTLKQNKVQGELFPKAVRNLAAAANRYMEPLKTTLTKTTDERDKGLILSSLESCEAILDSVKQLPPETTKADKKKKT
jgi:hypothetical protein